MKKANEHLFGPEHSKHLAAARLTRAQLYLDRVGDSFKANDPIHALSNAAELSEIARRLCNDFQKIIDAQSEHSNHEHR